jgi:hypothetical protein
VRISVRFCLRANDGALLLTTLMMGHRKKLISLKHGLRAIIARKNSSSTLNTLSELNGRGLLIYPMKMHSFFVTPKYSMRRVKKMLQGNPDVKLSFC